MGKDRSPWRDGRRAWERLNGWHQDSPSAHPGHPDDGQAAVDALADIGHVRHLLDHAELVAVRTARKHGKSWAEIATKLGVTRQSAWERWRDLDDADVSTPTETDVERDAVVEVVAAEASDRMAREWRRQSSVVVPNVIGMSWDNAFEALQDVGLVGVGSDPDGPPIAVLGWPGVVVTDQSPESGAKVPAGSPVTLWIERGGGSAGVREPRRPKPSPKSAHEMRPEPSAEAVG
jgi:DNA-binding Lrp family transcriptional regulator